MKYLIIKNEGLNSEIKDSGIEKAGLKIGDEITGDKVFSNAVVTTINDEVYFIYSWNLKEVLQPENKQ